MLSITTTTTTITSLMKTLLPLLIAQFLDCARADILRISQPASLPVSTTPEGTGKLNVRDCVLLYKPARENCSISALEDFPELAEDITSQYCEYLNSMQRCTVQAVCTACSNVSALHVYPKLYHMLKVDMRRADCAGHFFSDYSALYGNVSRFVSNFVCSGNNSAVILLPQFNLIHLIILLFLNLLLIL